MNNNKSYFDSPIFRQLDAFAEMFEESLRKNSVQNPDDASDEKGERDYDPGDLMPQEDLEGSRTL